MSNMGSICKIIKMVDSSQFNILLHLPKSLLMQGLLSRSKSKNSKEPSSAPATAIVPGLKRKKKIPN